MTIQTHAEDRRTLVQQISEHLRVEAHYQGPPTFSYAIGPVTVARDGSITCEAGEVMDTLRAFLTEKGYIEPERETTETETLEMETPETDTPEVDTLEIAVPIEGMDGSQLRNLVHMLYSYQYLLGRVTHCERIRISEAVVTRLSEYQPETVADFESLMNDFKALGDLIGVDFKDGTFTLTFPLDDSPEKNKAYADLTGAIVRTARSAKRIKATVHRPENEKYVLRSWLLRLGFGGADFKASRKALLVGLKGHTAFRSDAEALKHKEKYAEARRIAREAREGEAQ